MRQGYSHEAAFAKVQEAHLAQHQRRVEQAKKLDKRHAELHPLRSWERKPEPVPQEQAPLLAQVNEEGPEWPFDDWGTIHDKDEPEYAVFTSGRE